MVNYDVRKTENFSNSDHANFKSPENYHKPQLKCALTFLAPM